MNKDALELHKAVKDGCLELVKNLVDAGVNLNGLVDNKSPLMTACSGWMQIPTRKTEYLQIIHYLVSKGADPHIKDKDGRNCFELVKSCGCHYLSVELSLCCQQRNFMLKNKPNLTGNIYGFM